MRPAPDFGGVVAPDAQRMFEHAIVGIDGGEGRRDALALERVLVDPDGKLPLATSSALPPRAVARICR